MRAGPIPSRRDIPSGLPTGAAGVSASHRDHRDSYFVTTTTSSHALKHPVCKIAVWDPLRSDARFAGVLKKHGLD